MNYTCTVILKKSSIEMFQVYLLLQLAFVSVLGNSVAFINCASGSYAYRLTDVSIEGCDDHIPCVITIGDQLNVKLEFFADFVSPTLDQNVVLNVLGVHAKPDVTPETCPSETNANECPVMTANTRNLLHSVMEVPVLPLNQRGNLKWEIYNEAGKLVLCYQIRIQTQNGIQKFMRDFLRKKTAPITHADQP